MTTSPKPSPFTSPADDTDVPKFALAWSDSAVQAAVLASPSAEPRYKNARPSSVSPLS